MSPNNARTNDSGSSRNSNNAFNALLEKVRGLSFLPFQMCVLLWLGAKGFESIRPLGRIHRRGRRAKGGADFLAKAPGSETDVAIQVRHWRMPLQRRTVDELWGFMLRRGVPLGLIVTSSEVMKSAEKAVWEYPGRPIQLVSCRQLCSSMASLELGLRKAGSRWLIDEAFFESAGRLAFASAMGIAATPGPGSRVLDGVCRLHGKSGEPRNPDSQPPILGTWLFIAVVIALLAALLWLKLGSAR